MGRKTSWGYYHQKGKIQLLLSHYYLHPHQYYFDLIVYFVS